MSVTKMAGICSLNPTTLMTLKRIHGIRCCSGATENENKSQTRTKTPQILKLAVSGVTELLRVFSFSGKERCFLTPGDPYMPLTNDKIIERVSKQVLALFPSSQGLEVTWSSVVKIAQSLYREGPGKDPFRPNQRTPVKNFFLAGSYTKQDYIDSMEGATLSGRQASAYVCGAGEELVALRKTLAAVESQESTKSQNVANELSLA